MKVRIGLVKVLSPEYAWRKISKQHRKDFPYCWVCQVKGSKRQRLHVHHLYGRRVDPNHEHLISLCPGCHEIITIIARRTANRYTWQDIVDLWELATRRREGL
jgi:hypothetical protein